MPETSLLYRALVRSAIGAASVVSPFSGKLARGHAGRRGAVAHLAAWSAAHRDRNRPLLWFHAPSVGEGLQARAVLEVLRARHPDWQIAFTHFSPSAETLARQQPSDVSGYVPYDSPTAIDAALDVLSPAALIFVKLDVWPELACRAAERGVRVALVAATVSPVSSRRRWPARAIARPAYAALNRVGAISDDDARRLVGLGAAAERVRVTGDPRFDSVLAMVSRSAKDDPLRTLRVSGLALVAGSTWPGDEGVLLDAYAAVRRGRPEARLILAPHEPTPAHLTAVERGALVRGLPRPMRLSATSEPADILLVDRLGFLARLYGAGALAYVGGGFGRAGLHSVLEPAAWGIPVVFGPRWQTSREAGLLLDAGAAVAVTAQGAAATLASTWLEWLENEDGRHEAGNRALSVVRNGAGGAERNAELVEELLIED